MAMDMVKTTRDELLRTRQELKIAREGKDILERKKEALLGKFLAAVRQYKGKREVLLGDLVPLKQQLILTRARDGSFTIKSLALATAQRLELELSHDNVMGTKYFHLTPPVVRRDLLSRGYNPTSTTSRIESVAQRAERVLERMLEIAHLEHNLKTLGREMRSLNRKINALEDSIIPGLLARKRFIEEALEQTEREEVFRLKLVKRARQRQTHPAPA